MATREKSHSGRRIMLVCKYGHFSLECVQSTVCFGFNLIMLVYLGVTKVSTLCSSRLQKKKKR
jgi:hypothetical protein